MLRLTYIQLQEATEILTEASSLTYDQLFKRSDPKRIFRSGQVRGPPLEIDGYKDALYHTFNFKSYPSTTGNRHRGYIKFESPTHGRPMPAEKLPVMVDCDCPDFRYRWAWANKQRGASKVGSQSMNQALNRAPRITNPQNKVGLCKHLLAARGYIYGLIQKFDKGDQASRKGGKDIAWKLDQLVQMSRKKWINIDQTKQTGLFRQDIQRQVQQARNIAGPMAAAEVPPNIDREMPVPLPPVDLAVPPGQRGRGMPQGAPQDRRQMPPPAPPQPPALPPPPPGQPPQAGQRPQNRRNRNQGESVVVMAAAENNSTEPMNKDLLNRTKAIVEALQDDNELAKEVADGAVAPDLAAGGHDDGGPGPGGPGGPEGALPPPPTDEFGDMPGGPGGPEGLEGGAPEDEALGLLRDIAAGVTRLADEIAPAAELGAEGGFGGPDGAEPPAGAGAPEGGSPVGDEGEKKEEDEEPGVPPVEDDDDEFNETMPVASGA